jgi:hypothetical protein
MDKGDLHVDRLYEGDPDTVEREVEEELLENARSSTSQSYRYTNDATNDQNYIESLDVNK